MNLTDDIIGKFLDGCYDAGIKDPLRFLIDKMPRTYGYLKGAFPRGILPTDIDGEVEIGGHFLRLEFKHEDALRSGRVPTGQKRCFDALRETGYFTIFLCGHDAAGQITCLHIYYRNGGENQFKQIDPCNNATLKSYCSKWAARVQQKNNNTTTV